MNENMNLTGGWNIEKLYEVKVLNLTKKEIMNRNLMIATLIFLIGFGLLLTANPFTTMVAYLAL